MKTFVDRLKTRVPLLSLVGIILLAAYLRLLRVSEYMTFLGDEGRDMLVIKKMIVDHTFTLLGPTASVGGFFLGPIYYYFMLPFVWAWNLDPTGAAFMVGLFGVATVYVVYLFGSRLFDRWTGLVAALLYALSPVVIAYSRSSWNPNLVPFFSLMFLYCMYRAVAENRPALLFWMGVMFGVGLQLHYLFLFLAPVAVFWLLLYAPKKDWLKWYAVSLLGFVIGYGPFLAFELRHNFPNTQSIIRFLLAGDGTGFSTQVFMRNVSDVSYRLFGRLLYRLPPPEQWSSLAQSSKAWWSSIVRFTLYASVALMVVSSARLLSKKMHAYWSRLYPAREMTLLLLWYVVPVFLFGIYKKGIYDYYFGLFFPLPFLLFGLLTRSLLAKRIYAVVAVVFVGIVAVFNWMGRPYVHPPNNQLGQAKMIAQRAYELADGKPFNFALMTGGNSDHAYRFFFEVWGNAPVPIQNDVIDPDRNTVTDQLIVICELAECKPLGSSLWEIAGFGRADIDYEEQVSFVRVMRLVHFQK